MQYWLPYLLPLPGTVRGLPHGLALVDDELVLQLSDPGQGVSLKGPGHTRAGMKVKGQRTKVK